MSTLPIALVGMMGSGKSTIAKKISYKLNVPFQDLDDLITSEIGCSIQVFFQKYGERTFRQIEARLFQQISKQTDSPLILATGGGVIIDEENRKYLKRNWWSVYLQTSPYILVKRLKKEVDSRPLLNENIHDTLEQKIHDILETRHPLYLEVASFIVDTSSLSVEEVCSSIVAEYQT
ncbi:shikimate kinase [Alicyclobacillus tolerans]|uniref:Shikimate kinase n=2 Tax=Alicyclobacillus tolerans TaxID=90970 RepID=A0ABT9LWW4_9BACL|nr:MULTISPECIES: shikimate kinase [Alicyclobacillus]MDP9728761.1 shikimate kinase [Alicyclobacillus tengchongensis]QRF23228.1 shikimate kinase [Alicyclobacillus sp. TC]SHK38691.1 shikimate kinase [Alicyclobacillus montanus]